MGKLASAGLNSWVKGFASQSKHIHSFSRVCLGSNFRSMSSVPTAIPARRFGCVQMRGFSRADHTQVSGDNQKTEELLEKFEVQEGNQEARPQHTILHQDQKGRGAPAGGAEWPERMTKGIGI